MRTAFMVPALAALALGGAGACNSTPQPGAPGDSAAVATAAATITPGDVYDRIAFLASDELRGRNTPSPGLERAAEWIAAELESFGLEPAGEEGWLQRYPYPLEGLAGDEAAFDIVGGATHTLQYGADFFAQAGREPAGGLAATGVIYVGDEVRSDPALRDRAVMLRLPGAPEQARGGLRLPRDARAAASAALSAADEAGAAAVVFVLDPGVAADQVEALAAAAESPSRRLGGSAADAGPPAFYLTRRAATRLLGMAGLDAAEQLRRTVDRPVPLSGITLRLSAPLRTLDDAEPPNVVGMLRGSDPELRDTYIVLSAHFDHVGVGRPDESGDSIYNGADDDASGTAALVEVAEAFASLEVPPRRSLIFLAVSGEEKGLLGSRWFSDHPTVPVESIVANVNLDMVGRNASDSIVVIGQQYSSLGPTLMDVSAAHPDLGLTVAEDIWPEQRFFFRSDHFNFARLEIPALFFFAGVHEDYHRPSDHVDDIDTDKNARVARLAFLLTNRIANDEQAPQWTEEGLAEIRRLTGNR